MNKRNMFGHSPRLQDVQTVVRIAFFPVLWGQACCFQMFHGMCTVEWCTDTPCASELSCKIREHVANKFLSQLFLLMLCQAFGMQVLVCEGCDAAYL